MKEFISAIEADTAEENGDERTVNFKLDGREMVAYYPTDGQLTFLLATMGRGQTDDGRFASIINIMLSCLRDADRDHFEARLLTRDPKQRLKPDVIEKVFEHLMEEWFGDPTQSSSDSAPSLPSDGTN